jgi:hypothetical protein
VVFFIAAPPLRYPRARESQSEPCVRAARLSVRYRIIFRKLLLESFCGGAGGAFFKKHPLQKPRPTQTQKGKIESGFSLLLCIYRKPVGAVFSSH